MAPRPEHAAPTTDHTEPRPEHARPDPAPRKRIWTAQTWVTLAVCVALLIGATVWVSGLDRASASTAADDAPLTMSAFLDAVTTGDETWQDHVTPSYLEHLDGRSPIFGDPATAELLDLRVTYAVDEIEYVKTHADYYPSNPIGSDLAQTVVHFTYEYTVLGDPFTATMQQAIFMTRPYYYDDSSTPSAADTRDERTPDAVGPWQVTNMRSPINIVEDHASLETVSDYAPASPPPAETYVCMEEGLIFAELSESARRDGTLATECAHGPNNGFEIGAGLDPEQLALEFPVLNIHSASPPEIMRLSGDSVVMVPLEQFRVPIGGEPHVITLAKYLDDATGAPMNRVVSIAKEATA